jgi:hypothetical protein
MSLSTWQQLYCPITAEEAAKLSPAEAIQHSLTKWRGLRQAVLDAHELRRSYCDVVDCGDSVDGGDSLSITGASCSLCAKYCDYSKDEPESCANCPLARLGASGTDCFVEYRRWRDYGDPEPMIALLEKALAEQS